MANDDFQDRGDAARAAAGIDGTAGDAQDKPHRYQPDTPHTWCLLCGLGPAHNKHVPLDAPVPERASVLAYAHGMAERPTPRCGARTVFWPEVEHCEAECALDRGHQGTIHEDETLGEWDEDDMHTYPAEP